MRLLLDENLSPLLGELLRAAGHDTVHVRDLGMLQATDRAVLERARAEGRTLLSADTDFGRLLAESGAAFPSAVLLRRELDRRASAQARLLLGNLAQVEADLDAGAIVVLEATRLRVRPLPVVP